MSLSSLWSADAVDRNSTAYLFWLASKHGRSSSVCPLKVKWFLFYVLYSHKFLNFFVSHVILEPIITVVILVKFWTHNIIAKFRRNFRQYFASTLRYFPPPLQNTREITYTKLSNVFHFGYNFEIIILKTFRNFLRFNT